MVPHRSSRKKQVSIETALSRAKLSSSQPEAARSSPAVNSTPATGSRKRGRPAVSEDNVDDDVISTQYSRTKRRATSSQVKTPPTRHPSRRQAKKPMSENYDSDVPLTQRTRAKRQADSTPAKMPIRISRRQQAKKAPREEEEEEKDGGSGSGSGSDDDVVLTRSTRSKRKDILSSQAKTRPRHSDRQQPKKSGSKDDDEDEDDDAIVTPATSRRRGKRAGPALALDEDDGEESEEDLIPPSTRARRRQQKGLLMQEDPSSTEEEEDNSPAPAPRSARKRSKGKSRHQKQLELLRRRRRGENVDIDDITSSSEESEVRGIYDSGSELEALTEFPDESEPEEEADQILKKKKKPRQPVQDPVDDGSDGAEHRDSNEEDLSDFIDDDHTDLLGAPEADAEIPLEFRTAQYKPRDWFRLVIAWLLHRKLGGDPNQDIFVMAWKKLDDEASGHAMSKFTSSSWKETFVRTLAARPGFMSHQLPKGSSELYGPCQACGRSRHPATFSIQFAGSPYDKNTLEDVDSSESESKGTGEEEDSDDSSGYGGTRSSIDAYGLAIEKEGREFFVGSTCHSNAEIAHRLTHWRHALQEWVDDQLVDMGYMTPAEQKKRRKMTAEKRSEVIEDIAERWEEQGTIQSLYRDYKGLQERAREQSTAIRGGRR